jgi:hypothetical protein
MEGRFREATTSGFRRIDVKGIGTRVRTYYRQQEVIKQGRSRVHYRTQGFQSFAACRCGHIAGMSANDLNVARLAFHVKRAQITHDQTTGDSGFHAHPHQRRCFMNVNANDFTGRRQFALKGNLTIKVVAEPGIYRMSAIGKQ